MNRILSISGRERKYLEIIQSTLTEYTDECYFDRFGNLVAHKAGSGKKLMFCCAADEFGFVVSHIGKDGQIFVNKLGNFSEKDSALVISDKGVKGVLSAGDEIVVLTGASTKEEAENAVEIGDVFGYCNDICENEHAYFGADIEHLIAEQFVEAIKQIKTHENDLYFVFNVQSKLNGRGEKTAVHSIQPDCCYLFTLSDTKKILTDEKKSVGVRLRDKSTVYDKELVYGIINACHDIPLSAEIYDDKDFGAGNIVLSGTDLAVVTIPTENSSTLNSLVLKKNIHSISKIIRTLISLF